MIRLIQKKDKNAYIQMALDFYASGAALAPIPKEYIEKTFDQILAGSPFASAYLFEVDGVISGYALLSHTWSQEAGGEVVWIEELFVLPEKRNLGLGHQFFSFLEETYQGKAKRFRLEVEEENEGAVRLYEKMGFSFFPYNQMKKDF